MKKFVLLIFLAACSSGEVNQNYVQRTQAEFSGGVYQNQIWKDSLVFERVSWYRELSMVFDFFFLRLDSKSKFYQWLSDSEKDLAKKCHKFFIGMSYSRRRFNRALITQTQLKTELAKYGLVHYPLIDFSRHLRAHADFLRWTAGYYSVGAYCLTRPDVKAAALTFPGFQSQSLSL